MRFLIIRSSFAAAPAIAAVDALRLALLVVPHPRDVAAMPSAGPWYRGL